MPKQKAIDDRNPRASTAEVQSVWRRRGTVLGVTIASLVFLILLLAGPSWAIVIYRLLSDGFLLVLWLIAAAGLGALIPLPVGVKQQSLRLVSTIALGIGIISVLQLGLGLAGLLHRSEGIAIIGIGVWLAVWRYRKIKRDDVARWLSAPADWEWLWLLAMPALAITIVAALVPPGVLWGDEPHGYDVLEYHLQLPREWYEMGRIAPLHHNVFSYFPQGVEMHYLLAMQLRGGPWEGMYLAQLMHVAMTALSVVAVYAAAREIGPKLPAMLAAIATANVPWIALLAPVAYNEGGLLLFATLAIGWLLLSLSKDEIPTVKSWIIAGAFAGFACGVKLTAVPQVLLLMPLIFAIVAIVRRKSGWPPHVLGRDAQATSILRNALSGAAAFVVTGTILFSPWLIRNLVWAGNPVFPEAQNILGRAHFTDDQSERWRLAHSPTLAQQAIGARLIAARDQIAIDWRFGFILLPVGLAAAVVSIARPQAQVILALLLAWLVFWIGFTHLQGRFFVLAIPLAAMGLALLHNRWMLAAGVVVVMLEICIGLGLMLPVFTERVGPLCNQQLLGVTALDQLLPEEIAEVFHWPDAPIALVGDAKAFLYPGPMSRLSYRTVFDVAAKPGESVISAWMGSRADAPIVIIDPVELERFAQTYYAIPPLAPDVPGPRDKAFILDPATIPNPAAPR